MLSGQAGLSLKQDRRQADSSGLSPVERTVILGMAEIHGIIAAKSKYSCIVGRC
jgi:hypothetical protein